MLCVGEKIGPLGRMSISGGWAGGGTPIHSVVVELRFTYVLVCAWQRQEGGGGGKVEPAISNLISDWPGSHVAAVAPAAAAL